MLNSRQRRKLEAEEFNKVRELRLEYRALRVALANHGIRTKNMLYQETRTSRELQAGIDQLRSVINKLRTNDE